MILRPRQSRFVNLVRAALKEHGNTLGVAPTGFGKSLALASIDDYSGGERSLTIQHRDELLGQNRRAYHTVNRGALSGVIDGESKQFGHTATFAMVQTLSREGTLERLKPVDLLKIDEAHHIAADGYLKVIDHCRKVNPSVRLLGLTATPERGDRKSLRVAFTNCADQVSLGELIAAGNLVPPRTFVIDLGVGEALAGVKKTAADFDMTAVEAIMDRAPLNSEIVRLWKEKAGDRLTAVFASTTKHAEHVAEAFRAAGVSAEAIGEKTANRRDILARLERRELQVIVNVAVLVEGWDCPPVSCVVLLRPNSHKSVFIQMVGRGLRTIDPERYPGVIKNDCYILDFGSSTLQHGSLEMEANLDAPDKPKGEAPTKECPSCEATIPMSSRECPLCGHDFPRDAAGDAAEKETLSGFHLVEVDLLKASPYRWVDPWDDDSLLIATAFDHWGLVIWYFGKWVGLGGGKETGIRVVAVSGERTIALAAADDYLREHGDSESAAKSRSWMNQTASPAQLQHLGIGPLDGIGINKYMAACRLTWKFSERGIRAKLEALSTK